MTLAVNQITNNTTEARIGTNANVTGVTTTAGQPVYLNASHKTTALTVAGALAAAKTAGVGGAGAVEVIGRDVRPVVDQGATVSAAGHVAIVDAAASLTPTTVAGGAAGGRDAAVAGSLVVQTLTTDTLAAISKAVVVNAGLVRVTADSGVTSTPVAGTAAGSRGVGIGTAGVVFVQTDKTVAQVDDAARVTTTGGAVALSAPTGRRNADGSLAGEPVSGLAVVATAGEQITPVAPGRPAGGSGWVGRSPSANWT